MAHKVPFPLRLPLAPNEPLYWEEFADDCNQLWRFILGQVAGPSRALTTFVFHQTFCAKWVEVFELLNRSREALLLARGTDADHALPAAVLTKAALSYLKLVTALTLFVSPFAQNDPDQLSDPDPDTSTPSGSVGSDMSHHFETSLLRLLLNDTAEELSSSLQDSCGQGGLHLDIGMNGSGDNSSSTRRLIVSWFSWLSKLPMSESRETDPTSRDISTLSKTFERLFSASHNDEAIQMQLCCLSAKFRCRGFFQAAEVGGAFVRTLNSEFSSFAPWALVGLLEGTIDPSLFYPSDIDILVKDILPRYMQDSVLLSWTQEIHVANGSSGRSKVKRALEKLGFGSGETDDRTQFRERSGGMAVDGGAGRFEFSAPVQLWAAKVRLVIMTKCYAPSAKDCGVDAVVEFFSRLPLRTDYTAKLRSEAIDGEVLFSDLGRKDLFDMGVTDFEDVETILQVLNTIQLLGALI